MGKIDDDKSTPDNKSDIADPKEVNFSLDNDEA